MIFSQVQLWLILAGLLVNIIPALRAVSKYFVTLFHEAGHAIGSLLTGGGVLGIVVYRNGEGLTTTSHLTTLKGFFSRVVTKILGYPGPVLWATLFIAGAVTLEPAIVVALFLTVGVVNLIFSRSLFTLFISAVYILVPTGILFANDWQVTELIVNYVIFFAWMLFFGVFKTLKDLISLTIKSPEVETDAVLLARDLRVHPRVGLFVILLFSLVALLTPLVPLALNNNLFVVN